MDTTDFNTAARPLMQRGAYWLDEVCARHIGVFGRTHLSNNPFFFGRMRRTEGAGAVATTLICSAGIAQRRADEVRRWTHDTAVVFVERGVGSVWQQRGRELRLQTGDMVVANPDEPYALNTLGDFNLTSYYVPAALLKRENFPGDPNSPTILRAREPAGGLASGFAVTLADQLAALPDTAARGMIETLAKLVSVAAGAAAPPHGAALRAARLQQALDYIDRHLADPELTPAFCARALGVSLRGLHLAFEPTGESFSQALARRRLERCRALLTDRGTVGRPVSDLAFACGFGSLAGFYRAFSRTYGTAPTDMRPS